MNHRHLPSCESTQIYLLHHLDDFLRESEEGIVTTSRQTKGLTRGGDDWDFFDHALAALFYSLTKHLPHGDGH